MLIFVRNSAGAIKAMPVRMDTSVQTLCQEIGCGCESVSFGGRILPSGPLSSFGVMCGSTLDITLAVRGGKGKKKKKKVFTKAKKPIHRHKNVKMRVLKYYKVTGNGEDEEYKVTAERKECRHPQCGSGVFFAQHHNRITCGKCSLTYTIQKK